MYYCVVADLRIYIYTDIGSPIYQAFLYTIREAGGGGSPKIMVLDIWACENGKK